MSHINFEKLLSPVDGTSPTGPSLAERREYSELERMAQGRPEQQVGASIIPAVPPDWDAVRKRCVELLEQTKDLRVAMHLVVALLQTEGLPGLRDGLQVLKGMLERYWDSLHPQLDPEDGNDPIERVNILRVMAPRTGMGGDSGMVKLVRTARLTSSRQLGGFGLRDIELASNGTPKDADTAAAGAPKVDLALIEASAKDTDAQYLQAAAAAARESAGLVRQIEAIVDEKVGAGNGVDLKELARALDAAGGHLNKFLALKGLAPTGPAGGEAKGDGAVPPSASPTAQPVSGDIRSTEDVRRLIDKMCDFYARTEPSSPVPIVLRRAQRLVGKNFWEILTDLSPSALDSVKTISGTEGPDAPP